MITGVTGGEERKEYYYRVEPDSHFFENIDQIIAYVEYMRINKKAKNDLLLALNNTKKNGFSLLKMTNIEILPAQHTYITTKVDGLSENEIDNLIKLTKELVNFKLNK
jgi:hypothetical protein